MMQWVTPLSELLFTAIQLMEPFSNKDGELLSVPIKSVLRFLCDNKQRSLNTAQKRISHKCWKMICVHDVVVVNMVIDIK